MKEVRLSEKKKERIDAFLQEVNQRIMRVPSTPETEVRLMVWVIGKPGRDPQQGHLKQGPCYLWSSFSLSGGSAGSVVSHLLIHLTNIYVLCSSFAVRDISVNKAAYILVLGL